MWSANVVLEWGLCSSLMVSDSRRCLLSLLENDQIFQSHFYCSSVMMYLKVGLLVYVRSSFFPHSEALVTAVTEREEKTGCVYCLQSASLQYMYSTPNISEHLCKWLQHLVYTRTPAGWWLLCLEVNNLICVDLIFLKPNKTMTSISSAFNRIF